MMRTKDHVSWSVLYLGLILRLLLDEVLLNPHELFYHFASTLVSLHQVL